MSETKGKAVKYLSTKDLIDIGFLQEANRQHFHPLGLALEVDMTDGTLRIWDCRDDPEGVTFADGVIDPDKASRVTDEYTRHWSVRAGLFGGRAIQPVPDVG
jgi:hypothetical protein